MLLTKLYWLQQQHNPYFVQRGPSVSVKGVGPSQLGELMQVVVNPFLNKPLFYWSVVNTVEKGEIAPNKQFLLFSQFFTLFENFTSFSSCFKVVFC